MEIKDNYLLYTIQNNTSIDEILNFWHLGKKTKYKLYQESKITVNNHIKKQSCLLQQGDVLKIDVELSPIQIDSKSPIQVLYEDAILLIVYKPKGFLVHSDGSKRKNIQTILKAYYPSSIKDQLQALHRIDIDTSGILLFSKNVFFQPKLDSMIETNTIQRNYLAIVEGILTYSCTICSTIARDRHQANKMRVSKNGKSAITHIDVLQSKNHLTMINCRLETGRTHQIRVHLASIHFPLLGDLLYNPKKSKSPMYLHSYRVQMIHPITNKQLNIICQPHTKDWLSDFDPSTIKHEFT